MRTVFALSLFLVVLAALSPADTFTHRSGQPVYHGYATQTVIEGRTLVQTEQEGPIELNLAEFSVTPNAKGRNNTIAVISLKEVIQYELTTAAFEKAIVEESNKGPLLILIEIDGPGGRTDYAERMCAAILGTRNCRTVAFVSGGGYGGAYSAAAAVALACDAIYMAPGTSIGAATQYVRASSGKMMDMKEAYGDTLGEKFQSVWRNYLASLAQRNNRSGLMAKAMVDKDIEVLEVVRGDKTLFIEANDRLPGDQFVRVRCKAGEVLTLPAAEAATGTIADGVAASRDELLDRLGYADAALVFNTDIPAANEELNRVIDRFNRLNAAVDLKYKEIDAKIKAKSLTRSAAIRDIQDLVRNADYLFRLKQNYPDVPASEAKLQEFVTNVKALELAIRAIR
ncbi:MAG: hypothetical protein GXY41_09310 [Phycisphaerae bacterium]|nr:hypothetical protein [Phycisphaerae bacterium]